ncbi:MAG: T9SS type A sorting domain-containing protein, partial [Bacteroidota bacterium]
TTEFVVAETAELALAHVLNYPNPFTTHTTFMFEHNKPLVSMWVQVQVFTVTGKLIKTLDEYVTNDGFRNSSIEWDGKDDFGDHIGRGVYVYRVKVRTADGETADKYERLVVLK